MGKEGVTPTYVDGEGGAGVVVGVVEPALVRQRLLHGPRAAFDAPVLERHAPRERVGDGLGRGEDGPHDGGVGGLAKLFAAVRLEQLDEVRFARRLKALLAGPRVGLPRANRLLGEEESLDVGVLGAELGDPVLPGPRREEGVVFLPVPNANNMEGNK